jgi:hypothetical protein
MTTPNDEFGEVEQAGPHDPTLRNSPRRGPEENTPEAEPGAEAMNNNCFYNGKEYSNGALLCQFGELFQCSYGYWVNQGRSCGS